jgi:hypothetical protein
VLGKIEAAAEAKYYGSMDACWPVAAARLFLLMMSYVTDDAYMVLGIAQ